MKIAGFLGILLASIFVTTHAVAKTTMAGNSMSYNLPSSASLFTYVTTPAALQEKLQQAKSMHQPVMIEFFATWCSDCKKVDDEVLSVTDIRNSMKNFSAVRVDVSEPNAAIKQLMKEYGVIGVPTMIFYDKKGDLSSANHLDGSITKDNLQSVLRKLS